MSIILLILACNEPGFQGTEVIWGSGTGVTDGETTPTVTETTEPTTTGSTSGGSTSGGSTGGGSSSSSGGTSGGSSGSATSSGGSTSSGGTEKVSVEVVDPFAECGPDLPGGAEVSASVSGDGVAISHIGYESQCCAEWEYETLVDYPLEGDLLQVRYIDAAKEVCDCDCPWAFDYTLVGLPPGEWLLDIQGTFIDVTVEP